MKVEIIAHSQNTKGEEIITYVLTYPRIIHAELLTHRVFSRNSSSSRAIPANKMIDNIMNNVFVPIDWQRKHKGMQGSKYFESDLVSILNFAWKDAALSAIKHARKFAENRVTKQLINRLLEPFSYITVIVTATEWDNFFKLRCPRYELAPGEEFFSKKDAENWMGPQPNNKEFWRSANNSQAEIHIQQLAELMWNARNESMPKQLKEDEWHIPFGDKINDDIILEEIALEADVKKYNLKTALDIYQFYAIKIAVARCARVSYETHDGEINYKRDLDLYERLQSSEHWSPFEHVAKAMTDLEYYSYVRGKQPRVEIDYNENKEEVGIIRHEHYPFIKKKSKHFFKNVFNSINGEPYPEHSHIYGWCDNFKGFRSYRNIIQND
jgi:thymidylate synthase ThyX